MTVPADYNHQLQAHLQAWRQVLEALAALAATVPNLGPNLGLNPAPNPAMPLGFPPAPPGAPPADPTHQLFGYIQAWRNYLEQSVGTVSREPGRRGSSTTEDGSAHADTPPRRGEPEPPPDAGGSRTSKSSASPWPPVRRGYPADDETGGQVYGLGRRAMSDPHAPRIRNEDQSLEVPASRFKQAAVIARGERVARPPAMEAAGPTTPTPNLGAVTQQFRGLAERAGLE